MFPQRGLRAPHVILLALSSWATCLPLKLVEFAGMPCGEVVEPVALAAPRGERIPS
jgi:hypothetical protein